MAVRGKGGSDTAKPKQKPKGEKAETKVEAKPDTKAAEDNPRAVPGNNILNDDQLRALHFNHKKLYEEELALKKAQDAKFRNVCKLIKSEGGSVDEIKLAIQLDTPEGEKAAQAKIEQQLRVARWNGADFGHQFALLPETPSVDRAFEEGKIAGLKGVPKKPPHDSSVPQFKRWMEGYDDGQAVLVKKFTPPPAEAKKPPAPTAAEPEKSGDNPEVSSAPTNVVSLKGAETAH